MDEDINVLDRVGLSLEMGAVYNELPSSSSTFIPNHVTKRYSSLVPPNFWKYLGFVLSSSAFFIEYGQHIVYFFLVSLSHCLPCSIIKVSVEFVSVATNCVN